MIFNRYWICDKSGSGRGKWEYFCGDFDNDLADAREYILETKELWAMYADSYSLEIELNVKPPAAVIHQKLKDLIEAQKGVQQNIEALIDLIHELGPDMVQAVHNLIEDEEE